MDPRSRRVPRLTALLSIAAVGCTTTTYDYGAGPADAQGRPVEEVDGVDPSDAEWETESNNEVMLEESVEDVWEESDR